MLGSGYVIEHSVAAISRKNRREAFEVYVADCLRLSAMGMVAKGVTRFYDILHPAPVDDRDPKEIVAEITAKAGLKVVKKNNGNGNGTHGDAGD